MARWFLLIAATVSAASAAAKEPEAIAVFGTQSGQIAYDDDPFGGNPFASALVSVLSDDEQRDTAFELEVRTGEFSGGYQIADAPAELDAIGLKPADGEVSVALVMVFSDYGDDDGLVSLPGAAFDAARISKALGQAGYAVEMRIVSSHGEFMQGLDWFRASSSEADRALIYTTGHGIEEAGASQLVPPDADDENARTDWAPISVSRIAATLGARNANLVFYAACRERIAISDLKLRGERTRLR